MAARTSNVFSINDYRTDMDYRNDMDFRDLNGMQPAPERYIAIQKIPHNREIQYQETESVDRHRPAKSENSTCCSKRCLIGFAIGLTIGIVLLIAIVVPVGVVGFNRTLTSTMGTVTSTPNWLGTYQMDNACDTTSCCCLTNQITLSQASSGLLQITGSVTGRCNGASTLVPLTLSFPTGFQANINGPGDNIRLQLGQNNAYIAFVDLTNSLCSTTGLKTSNNAGRMRSMHLNWIICVLLIILARSI